MRAYFPISFVSAPIPYWLVANRKKIVFYFYQKLSKFNVVTGFFLGEAPYPAVVLLLKQAQPPPLWKMRQQPRSCKPWEAPPRCRPWSNPKRRRCRATNRWACESAKTPGLARNASRYSRYSPTPSP